MTKKQPSTITYKGRKLGIVILTAAQIFIGAIHVFLGFLLLAYENLSLAKATITYNIYTIVFGLLTVIFAVFIWKGEKVGWIGTVAVSLFVIVADSLVILDLPSVPGIPKFAGFGEILYSVLIMVYLFSSQVRKKFLG